MISEKSKNSPIIIVQPAEELRHPYEKALTPLGNSLQWVSDPKELLQTTLEGATIVLDLDCLDSPIETHLQKYATALAGNSLIALSSSDSSQLALRCIRSGFSDYLLKPASPEELAWIVRRCQQQQAFIERLEHGDSRSASLKTITQISSCTTPALVQWYALEFLSNHFQAKGAAWLKLHGKDNQEFDVVCSVPKRVSTADYLKLIPFESLKKGEHQKIACFGTGNERVVLLPCLNTPDAIVLLWGIKAPALEPLFETAGIIVEHCELTLLNIRKVEELKQQTFVDDLTGLYNSRFLRFAVAKAISRSKEPNHEFSVLFIDVDHFKQVNDKHGHLVGSEFLVTLGKTIKNAVRGIDSVFRYGGDEFVVVLHDTGTEGAMEIAERIRKNIARRIFVIRGVRLRATVSIGIASYPAHAQELETLLKLADEAMYSVKKSSRNAVHLALGLEAEEPIPLRKAG